MAGLLAAKSNIWADALTVSMSRVLLYSQQSLRSANRVRLTQRSSCQGGTDHFHQYIRQELSTVNIVFLRGIKSLPGVSELIFMIGLLFEADIKCLKCLLSEYAGS